MTEIFNDILKIIENEIGLMDEKVYGINFLESLKFNIMPKFSILKDKIEKIESLQHNSANKFQKNNNIVDINLIFNKESKTHLKKEILKDTLYLVLKGQLNLDFNKKNSKINIFPLMGVCLSSQSIINFSSLQNTFFIEFINLYSNSNIEKLKKDII